MGCIGRLGCAFVLVILCVVAYFTRDRWISKLPWRTTHTETSRVVVDDGWTPLTEAGAARTREALKTLSGPRGPVFVTLSGADVASYIFLQVVKQMPAQTDSFAARVQEDHIRLRARMRTKDLGSTIVSILGSLIGDRERVEMGGTLRVIGKGVAEFNVTDVKVHEVGLPDALINRLVDPLVHPPRPLGLHKNGLPIAIPSYIGDVRVTNGKITLYKNVP